MDSDHSELLAEAQGYYRNGEMADALTLVDVLLNETPDWSDALLLRGKVLFESGRKIEAAHTLRRVVELDPANAEAFYALGLTFRHLRKFDDAEGCLKAALRRNPDDLDARFVLANVLFAQQKLTEAIEHYEQVRQHRPDDADVHFNLGRAADDARQSDLAIDAYTQALALFQEDELTNDARTFVVERLTALRSGQGQPLDWNADPTPDS